MKPKFTRTTVDKAHVKGTLSKDCKYISYADDEDTKEIEIESILKPFKECPIELTVSLKDEEDLSPDYDE